MKFKDMVQCYLTQTPPTFEYCKEHFEDKGETLVRKDYEGVCKKMTMKPQYRKKTLKEESISLNLKNSQDKWGKEKKEVSDVMILTHKYIPRSEEARKRSEARMKAWKEAQTPESLQALQDEWKKVIKKVDPIKPIWGTMGEWVTYKQY